jgi:hypothetical protein
MLHTPYIYPVRWIEKVSALPNLRARVIHDATYCYAVAAGAFLYQMLTDA